MTAPASGAPAASTPASAPASVGPTVGELHRTVGAAIAARLRRILGGDEARARAEAEVLLVRFYVRFVVRRQGDWRDERARWAWIYRVATTHALRLLDAGARPGASVGATLPTMQALRKLDEAAQAAVVLAR